MKKVSLSYQAIAENLQANLLGEGEFRGCVSIDTRTMKKGDVFVALRGPNHDGHDYLSQAVERGASGLIVEEQCALSVPQLIVDDARLALGRLSQYWRDQFDMPVIAVTGSNGKTTVKEMISSILSLQGKTLYTEGNLNNDIGVPLTLLRLRGEHQFAVIEMGANHAGEIRYLAKLAKPCVSVITNAASAHLEGFVNLEGVAKAKAEIYEELSEQDVAVINDDDHYSTFWQSYNSNCKKILFSLGGNGRADICGELLEAGSLRIKASSQQCEVGLKLLGEHNARNALAAAAAVMSLGFGLEQIKKGLEGVESIKGRLALYSTPNGIKVLDDTYNANPSSLSVALDVLINMKGEAWLVLGDMGELGQASESMHYEMGEQARQLGISRLYTLGDLAAVTAEGFGMGAKSFEKFDDLVDTLTAGLRKGINILVKGSRAMQMERVVAKLLAADDARDASQSSQRYH